MILFVWSLLRGLLFFYLKHLNRGLNGIHHADYDKNIRILRILILDLAQQGQHTLSVLVVNRYF